MSSNRKSVEKPESDTIANYRGSSDEPLPYTPAQTAFYIGDLLSELKILAERAEMPFLAYLLDMAREEAEAQKRKRF